MLYSTHDIGQGLDFNNTITNCLQRINCIGIQISQKTRVQRK